MIKQAENKDEVKESSVSPNSSGGTITLKKTSLWKIGTFLFLGLFIISLFTGGFGGMLGGGKGEVTGGAIVNPPSDSGNVAPSGNINPSIESNDPVLGDKNAQI